MKAKEVTLLDLDELNDYTSSNPDIVHGHTYNMMNYMWNKTKSFSKIDLFIITLTDDDDIDEAILTLSDDEWPEALEIILSYFETTENYEMCTNVNKLLNKIKRAIKDDN